MKESIKENTDKQDIIRIKAFFFTKDPVMHMRRQATRCEKISANPIYDKEINEI